MAIALQPLRLLNPSVTGDFVSGAGTIFRQAFPDLAASADTGVLAATLCPTSGVTIVTTGITPPAVPRALRIKGNQATVTGNVVIIGRNQFGELKTDTIASSGTAAVQGVVAFSSIVSIQIPTRGAASDSISVGPGTAIGLLRRISEASALYATKDGGLDSALPTMNTTNHTATFATAPNTALDFALCYVHVDTRS